MLKASFKCADCLKSTSGFIKWNLKNLWLGHSGSHSFNCEHGFVLMVSYVTMILLCHYIIAHNFIEKLCH